MGKVSKFREIRRHEDLPQLKVGPITILMGANLRAPTKPKPSKKVPKNGRSKPDKSQVDSPVSKK